jgi:hypothetical protein
VVVLLLAVSIDELNLNPLLFDVIANIKQHVLLLRIEHDHLFDEARISFLLLHYEAFVLVFLLLRLESRHQVSIRFLIKFIVLKQLSVLVVQLFEISSF